MNIQELITHGKSIEFKSEFLILLQKYFLSNISKEKSIVVLEHIHNLLVQDKIPLLNMYHIGDGEYSYVIDVKTFYDKIEKLYSSYSEENFMKTLLDNIESNYDSDYGENIFNKAKINFSFPNTHSSSEKEELTLADLSSSQNNFFIKDQLILILNIILVEQDLEDSVNIEILENLYHCCSDEKSNLSILSILSIKTDYEEDPSYEINVPYLYTKISDLFYRYPDNKILPHIVEQIINTYTEMKISYSFSSTYEFKTRNYQDIDLEFQFNIINSFLNEHKLLQNPLVEAYINLNEQIEAFRNTLINKENFIEEFSRFSLIFNEEISDDDLAWPDFQPFIKPYDFHINKSELSKKLENLNSLYKIEINAIKEKIGINLLLLFIEQPDLCHQENEHIPLFLNFINHISSEKLLSLHTRFSSYHTKILSNYKTHPNYNEYILKTFSIFNPINKKFPSFLQNLVKKGITFDTLFIGRERVNSLSDFWTQELSPFNSKALPQSFELKLQSLNDLVKQLVYYCLMESLNYNDNDRTRLKL